MTTVAWDGESLAADRQTNSGSVRRETRKIRDCGRYVFAGCGDVGEIETVGEWLAKGASASSRPECENCGGIAVEKATGAPYVLDGAKRLALVPIRGAWAEGSGRDFALMAMRLGKGAREAVELAREFDVSTGCGVDEWRAPKRKAKK